MITEKVKNITIFKQALAGYLMMRGFVLICTDKSTNGSGRNVFFFKDSIELQEAINEYNNNKQCKL